jgi:hypothetical protein
MKNIFTAARSGKLKTKHDNKDLKAKSVNKYGLRSKSVNKARKK